MLLSISLNISKEPLESALQHSGISSALPLSCMYPGLPGIESICKMCLTLLFPVLNEIFLSQARQGTKRKKIAVTILGRCCSSNHALAVFFYLLCCTNKI